MLFEVVMYQTYYNQLCVNRFNYQSSGTPAAVSLSFALIHALGCIPETQGGTDIPVDGVLDSIRNVQDSAVAYTSIMAKAIYDVTDFYELPYVNSIPGGRSTSSGGSSPTLAWGFRTNRVRQDIKRGFKRFVGVAEEGVDPGGIATALYQSDYLTPAAAALGATVTYDDEGNTLTFVPAVAKKEQYTTPSGNTAYRYYETEAEQQANLATGIVWSYYTQVRTQNSRQYGKGS